MPVPILTCARFDCVTRAHFGLAVAAVIYCSVAGCSGISSSSDSQSEFVEETLPPDGATTVAVDTAITITFSMPTITDTLDGTIQPDVLFDVAWTDDRRTVTITPSDFLEPLTTYTVVVSAVAFEDGSSLDRDYTFNFTTADSADSDGTPSDSASDEVVLSLRTSLEAAESAGDDLDASLEAGMEIEDAIEALVDQLEAHSDVARAVASEDGGQMAVVYDSGLQVVYDVWNTAPAFTNSIDYDADISARQTHEFAVRSSSEASSLIRPARTEVHRFPAQQSVPPTNWAMPAGNKALVANALTSCAPSGYDLRTHVKTRLELLGYEVHESDAPVELFEVLADQRYSVIFIEGRGSGATVLEPILEAPLAGETRPPNTGEAGQKQIVTTSTPATQAMLTRYADDLRWGRLKIRMAWYRRDGVVNRCGSFLAVTPNFVRQHNEGLFPDRTFLCLNVGAMLSDTLQSGWFDLLKDSGPGGWFVSWARQPRYPTTMIALGNLFELMTGADNRHKARIEAEHYIAVEGAPVRPPLVSLPLVTAMNALTAAGEDVDLQTGATLTWLWDDDETQEALFVLAPVITDFWLDQVGQGVLRAYASDDSTLHVGDASINIGSYGPYVAGDGLLVGFGWGFPVPLNAAGPMSLRLPDGRRSRTLSLLTWNPEFTVTQTTTSPGPTIGVTYALAARALVSPRSRVGTADGSPWGMPASIRVDGFLDGGGCTVSWTVSGSHTEGTVMTRWEGGGSKTLSFSGSDGTLGTARFNSDPADASVLSIQINDNVTITYRETRTDTASGDVLITDHTHELSPLGVDIPVFSDLTLTGGTQTTGPGDDVETISWGSASPTPAFDPNSYRR